jgi:hypothetical protein
MISLVCTTVIPLQNAAAFIAEYDKPNAKLRLLAVV